MDLPLSSRLWRASARVRPNWGHPDHDACGTGFIARLNGAAGHDLIEYALAALERLTHRGGVDADGASGDGAGLLAALPAPFFRSKAAEQGSLRGLFFRSARSVRMRNVRAHSD